MSGAEPDRRVPERFRFWQGQALLSRELNEVATLAALMKGWHNRTLHDAFGVVEGLGVHDGGDGSIVVCPGTAYDIRGYPLVLDRERSIAFPSSGESSPQLVIARRGGHQGGSTPFQALDLAWVAPAAYRPTLGVALAVVEPAREGLVIRTGMRRSARGERRPIIGFGATVPGGTDWHPWSDTRIPRLLGGLQVTIDTGAAGFTETPCYFTSLQVTELTVLGILGPYVERIVSAGPARLTLSLWFVTRGRAIRPEVNVAIARRALSVAWLGIQGGQHVPRPPGNDSEGDFNACA